MLAGCVYRNGENGRLGCDGGDVHYDAVAELLPLECVDGELGGADGVGGVDLESLETIRGVRVGSFVEVPEVRKWLVDQQRYRSRVKTSYLARGLQLHVLARIHQLQDRRYRDARSAPSSCRMHSVAPSSL